MEPLNGSWLLAVWERGAASSPAARGCLVASAAFSGGPAQEDAAGLSIGQRNRALLEVWHATFGPRLSCRVDCPACGSQLELELDVAALLGVASDSLPAADLHLAIDGHRVGYRLLTTEDLLAVQDCRSLEEARLELVRRCVVSARLGGASADALDVDEASPGALAGERGSTGALAADHPSRGTLAAEGASADSPGADGAFAGALDGEGASIGELPVEMVAALGDALVEADPLVDVVLHTECAECCYSWSPWCDLGSLVWSEVVSAAARVLDDVHTLAQHYGWHEADILAMGSARRQAYLDRLGDAP